MSLWLFATALLWTMAATPQPVLEPSLQLEQKIYDAYLKVAEYTRGSDAPAKIAITDVQVTATLDLRARALFDVMDFMLPTEIKLLRHGIGESIRYDPMWIDAPTPRPLPLMTVGEALDLEAVQRQEVHEYSVAATYRVTVGFKDRVANYRAIAFLRPGTGETLFPDRRLPAQGALTQAVPAYDPTAPSSRELPESNLGTAAPEGRPICAVSTKVNYKEDKDDRNVTDHRFFDGRTSGEHNSIASERTFCVCANIPPPGNIDIPPVNECLSYCQYLPGSSGIDPDDNPGIDSVEIPSGFVDGARYPFHVVDKAFGHREPKDYLTMRDGTFACKVGAISTVTGCWSPFCFFSGGELGIEEVGGALTFNIPQPVLGGAAIGISRAELLRGGKVGGGMLSEFGCRCQVEDVLYRIGDGRCNRQDRANGENQSNSPQDCGPKLKAEVTR